MSSAADSSDDDNSDLDNEDLDKKKLATKMQNLFQPESAIEPENHPADVTSAVPAVSTSETENDPGVAAASASEAVGDESALASAIPTGASASASSASLGNTSPRGNAFSTHVEPAYSNDGDDTQLNLARLHTLLEDRSHAQFDDAPFPLVVLLGLTRAGKSTAGAWLGGASIDLIQMSVVATSADGTEHVGQKEVCQVSGETDFGLIGHGADAWTKIPSSKELHEYQLSIGDTAGFFDTEGAEVQIANGVCLFRFLRKAVKGIVPVVCIQPDLLQDPNYIGKLLSIISHTFGPFAEVKDSVLCIFTRASSDASEKSITSRLIELSNARHLDPSLKPLVDLALHQINEHGRVLIVQPHEQENGPLLKVLQTLAPVSSGRITQVPISTDAREKIVSAVKDLAPVLQYELGKMNVAVVKEILEQVTELAEAVPDAQLQRTREKLIARIEGRVETCEKQADVRLHAYDFKEAAQQLDALKLLRGCSSYLSQDVDVMYKALCQSALTAYSGFKTHAVADETPLTEISKLIQHARDVEDHLMPSHVAKQDLADEATGVIIARLGKQTDDACEQLRTAHGQAEESYRAAFEACEQAMAAISEHDKAFSLHAVMVESIAVCRKDIISFVSEQVEGMQARIADVAGSVQVKPLTAEDGRSTAADLTALLVISNTSIQELMSFAKCYGASLDGLMEAVADGCRTVVELAGNSCFADAVTPWANLDVLSRVECTAQGKLSQAVHGALLPLVDQLREKQNALSSNVSHVSGTTAHLDMSLDNACVLLEYLAKAEPIDKLLVADPWQMRATREMVQDAKASLSRAAMDVMTSCVGVLDALDAEGVKRAFSVLVHYRRVRDWVTADWEGLCTCMEKNFTSVWPEAGTNPSNLGSDLKVIDVQDAVLAVFSSEAEGDEWLAPLFNVFRGHAAMLTSLRSNNAAIAERIYQSQEAIRQELVTVVEEKDHVGAKERLDLLKSRADMCGTRPLRLQQTYEAACKDTTSILSTHSQQAIQAFKDANLVEGQELLSTLEQFARSLFEHITSVESLVESVVSSHGEGISEMKTHVEWEIERQRFARTGKILANLKASGKHMELQAYKTFCRTICDAYDAHFEPFLDSKRAVQAACGGYVDTPQLSEYVEKTVQQHRALSEFAKLNDVIEDINLSEGAAQALELLVKLCQAANMLFESSIEHFKFADAFAAFNLMRYIKSIPHLSECSDVLKCVDKAVQRRKGLKAKLLGKFEKYLEKQRKHKLSKLLASIKRAAESERMIFEPYLFDDLYDELLSSITERFGTLMEITKAAIIEERFPEATASMEELMLLSSTGCLSADDTALIKERHRELSEVALQPLRTKEIAMNWLKQLKQCSTATGHSTLLRKMQQQLEFIDKNMLELTLPGVADAAAMEVALHYLKSNLTTGRSQALATQVSTCLQRLKRSIEAVLDHNVKESKQHVSNICFQKARKLASFILNILAALPKDLHPVSEYQIQLKEILKTASDGMQQLEFGGSPADYFDICADFDVSAFAERLEELHRSRDADGKDAYKKFVDQMQEQCRVACDHMFKRWGENAFTSSIKPLFNLKRVQNESMFSDVGGDLLTRTIKSLQAAEKKLVQKEIDKLIDLRGKGKFKEFNAAMERVHEIDIHLMAAARIGPQLTASIIKDVERAAADAKKDIKSSLSDQDVSATVETLADFLIKIHSMTKDIAETEVRKATTSELTKLVALLKTPKSTILLSNLLSERGVQGNELIQVLPQFARARAELLNQRTAHVTINTALSELQKIADPRFKLSQTHSSRLKTMFASYEKSYRIYLDICLSGDRDLNDHINETHSRFEELRDKVGGNFDIVRSELVKLIACVTPVWAVKASKDHPDVLLKPHDVQILTLFMMLGLHTKPQAQNVLQQGFGWLKSVFLSSHLSGQLAQILTGEGKSLILGLLATILGLLGMPSRCVCYSSYLSNRDYNSFSFMFKSFKVDHLVQYGTFETMCESLVNLNGDVRKRTRALIQGKAMKAAKEGKSSVTPVWLVDEVDAFFQSALYGSTYNPGLTFMDEGKHLVEVILAIAANPKMSLKDVQALPAYSSLAAALPHALALLDSELAVMLKDACKLSTHEYEVVNGKIGYKTLEGIISTSTSFGYYTLFAYIAEHKKGTITEEVMRSELGLSILCGRYSYAKLPSEFKCIMGVTGTLDCLVPLQQEIMKDEYNIKAEHKMPSIFGPSHLKWNREEDIKMIDTQDRHFQAIAKRAAAAIKSKAAVLIFFRDDKETEAFVKSEYAKQIPDDKLHSITMRTTSIDFYVTKATTSGTVSCWSRVHGRGLDFIVNDQVTREAGGVVVIQTFVSEDPSEEAQIRGRTARSTEEGRYELILEQQSVVKQLGITTEEIEDAMDKKKLYKVLHAKRIKLFEKQLKDLVQQAAKARKRHVASVEYMEKLWSKDVDQADLLRLLQDIQSL